MCITRNQILTSVPLDRILIGLLVGSCYLIRSNGILLVPRITMAQLINFCEQPVKLKRYLQLNYQSILLPYVSLALIIFAITYYLPDGGLSNIGHLSISSAEHILENFLYNLTLPAEFFGHRAIYFVSSFFFAIGVIKFGDSRQLDLAYMVLTFAAYIVWPYQQGLRFLLPILPFYISFMISGIEIFLTNIHQLSWYGRVVRPISLAIALCFLIGQLVYAILIDQKNLVAGRVILDGIGSPASTELFNFIRAERRPEDIIVFRKPRAMHLMTGVKSVMLSDGIVIAKTLPVLLVIDSKNTDYQIDSATLSELIAAHPTDHLFANDQFSIYRIHN